MIQVYMTAAVSFESLHLLENSVIKKAMVSVKPIIAFRAAWLCSRQTGTVI